MVFSYFKRTQMGVCIGLIFFQYVSMQLAFAQVQLAESSRSVKSIQGQNSPTVISIHSFTENTIVGEESKNDFLKDASTSDSLGLKKPVTTFGNHSVKPFPRKAGSVKSLRTNITTMSAPKPVMIYGIHTDFRLSNGGQTHYNTLFADLAENGLEFSLRIRSMRRSIRSFLKSSSSCIFPSNIKYIQSVSSDFSYQNLIASAPVSTFDIKVFSNPSEPTFLSLDELNGKRVAFWGGAMLAPVLEQLNIIKEPTHNNSVRLKMLSAGRIDAVIAPDKDVYIASQALGISAPNADKNLTVFTSFQSSLVCRDAKETRIFLAEFDQELAKLKLNKRLQAILESEITTLK